MTGARIRKLMLGVAALAIVSGVVVAIATAPNSDGPLSPPATRGASAHPDAHTSDLALAAAYIGISTAQLRRELDVGSSLAEIANATAGRSASGLLDALLAPRAARLGKAVSTGRLSKTEQNRRLAKIFKRLGKEIHRHEGISVGPRDRATAARYLGLTVSEIRATLRSGRSLAQLANATRGRSPTGLIDALIRAKTATLAAEARAGKLSRAAHSAAIATLAQRMHREVYFKPRARRAGSG